MFRFFCFPLRRCLGDGCMARCAAYIDEAELNQDAPDRACACGGTGCEPEAGSGGSALAYLRNLFGQTGK